MAETAPKCQLCGSSLSVEEIDYPQRDDDGGIICEDCHHEKFYFACCCCEESGHVDDQHEMLVVFETISDVAPGVYRIEKHPCAMHAMIGQGWLHPEALTRIADVNPDMDGNEYPCGHLCAECQSHVVAQRMTKCSTCGQESSSCLKVKLGSWRDFKARKYHWTRPKVVCAVCRHKHKGAWRHCATKKENSDV